MIRESTKSVAPAGASSGQGLASRPVAFPFRDRVFWFCLSLSFLQGLIINLLPVTFKVFQKLFAATYEMQGRTEAMYFIGAILGSTLGGYLMTRIPLPWAIRSGLATASAGCFVLGTAQSFSMILAGSLMMGMGANWVSLVVSTIVSQRFQATRQRIFSAVTLVFSIGGLLAPTLVGIYISRAWLGGHWPWWLPYILLALAFLARLLVVPAWPAPAAASAAQEPVDGLPYKVLLRHPALWLISLATVLHGLGQMGATVWLARLYESRLGLEESRVGFMISANFLGVLTGRILLTTWLGGKLPDRVLLGCSATIGATFYFLCILNGNYAIGICLIALAGLGMSGDMVSLSSFTAQRFQASAARAFGISQAIGQSGAALGPYVIGFIGTRSGSLEGAVWLIPVTILGIAVLGFTWELSERSRLLRSAEVT